MAEYTKQITAQAAVGNGDVAYAFVNIASQALDADHQDRVPALEKAVEAARDAAEAAMLEVNPSFQGQSTAVTYTTALATDLPLSDPAPYGDDVRIEGWKTGI